MQSSDEKPKKSDSQGELDIPFNSANRKKEKTEDDLIETRLSRRILMISAACLICAAGGMLFGIQISKPAAGFIRPGLKAETALRSESTAASRSLIFSLDGRGPTYRINNGAVSLDDLFAQAKEIAAKNPGWPVTIEASYDVPVARLLELHRLISALDLNIEETRVRSAPEAIGQPPAYFITRLPAQEELYASQQPDKRQPELHTNPSTSPFLMNLPEVDTVELHWMYSSTSHILTTRKLTGQDAQSFSKLWRRQQVGQVFMNVTPFPQIVPAVTFYHEGTVVLRAVVDVGNSNRIQILEPAAARNQNEGIQGASAEGIELIESFKVYMGALFPKALKAAATLQPTP